MGKSLFVDEKKDELSTLGGVVFKNKPISLTIRIQGTTVDVVEIMERLKQTPRSVDGDLDEDEAVLYHFDVAPTVYFLFSFFFKLSLEFSFLKKLPFNTLFDVTLTVNLFSNFNSLLKLFILSLASF